MDSISPSPAISSRNGKMNHPIPNPALERLPPHDIAAEESVVAACMVDAHAIGKIMGIVGVEDFFREKNGWVYSAALALYERRQAINQITVAHELGKQDRLAPIGGSAYLAQLVADLPTVVGVEFYAGIVARCAAQRRLIQVAGKLAQMAYDDADTPQGVLATVQRMMIDAVGGALIEDWVRYGDVQAGDEAWLTAWMSKNARRTHGISTGLRALDRSLAGGGISPGKLILVGAQTSVGKSTWLRTVLRNIALRGTTCALVTVEQDRLEVERELLFSTAQVNRHEIETENRDATEQERYRLGRAMTLLGRIPLFISDAPGLTPNRIEARILALRAEHPTLEVVGIDYAQLIQPDKVYRRDDEAALAIIQSLRDTAARTGIATILTSQLTREGTDSNSRSPEKTDYRPKLRHFRGGGGMEFIPAAIIGLYREDWVYESGYREPPPDRTEYINGEAVYIPDNRLTCFILKQQLGPKGRADLYFDGRTRAIQDVE